MATVDAVQKPSVQTETPYKLDPEQVLKASQALLQHIQIESKKLLTQSEKRNLLEAESTDSEVDSNTDIAQPIWLTLSTKQHIVDKNRLKPSQIQVPNSLNSSPNTRICIISADPQRGLKDVVADPAFPKHLSSRIDKIIGLEKLAARYKTFESRRALLSEHDVFLADDRVVTRLPSLLGKPFYKGTPKRPIPIAISKKEIVDGKRVKSESNKKARKGEKTSSFATPSTLAKAIEKAIDAVPVSLKPGTNVAVRVGLATFTENQLAENIMSVAQAVIEKHVVKGWRNVKSIHIKTPLSLALPIWESPEMWVDQDGVDDAEDGTKAVQNGATAGVKRKRNPNTKKGPQTGDRKRTKVDRLDVDAQGRTESAARKARVAAQKAELFAQDS